MVTVRRNVVEFKFIRPGAAKVYLVGDFNGWRPDEIPMRQAEPGVWTTRLRLPDGTYRFRYRADGQWYTDFASFGVEPGPYGPVGVVYVSSKNVD